MKKVLMVQSVVGPLTGDNVVTAWMLEALKKNHEVTLLSWHPADVEGLNRYFGTSLDRSEFRTRHAPRLLRALAALDSHEYSMLGTCILLRFVKMSNNGYDVVIAPNGEADLGCRGIQYINYPYLAPVYREQFVAAHGTGVRAGLVRVLNHLRPWRLISGFSFERVKSNLTLSNSDWAGRQVRDAYGIAARTVYPPVLDDFAPVPWEERENGFVCIGRLSGEKRLDWIIDRLAEVRARGHDVHLHILGSWSGMPLGRPYYEKLLQLIRDCGDWVELHENAPRGELVRLVSTHRYGMHAMENEHFGIVVAEMILGGCIVFTHRSGGPLEITGGDDRLTFDTADDAVEKMCRVLDDPGGQAALLEHLAGRKDLFSADRFMREISEVVEGFGADNPAIPGCRETRENAS